MKLLHLIIIMTVITFTGCQETSNESKADTEVHNINRMEDPHSYAQPTEAVIKHLDLNISVNFSEKIIEGRASYQIQNNGVDKIYFDTREMMIEKIHIGKDKLEAEFELADADDYLGEKLTVHITPETELIHIYYQTSPQASALQWLSPQQTAGKKHPFLFTQSQAILARTWIPIQDSPGIRFTYTATVEVPNGLMALMSASNPTSISDNGTYLFEMNQPVPSYLMALAVGDLVFSPIGSRTGVYAEPSVLDKAVYEFGEMEDMLIAAEELYGEYRWDRYDVIVLPPSFPFGGMENPRLTFATPTILAGDRSLTALIAHELAHSWSGNLVTNASWDDFWLNEGFTVYFENRIMEVIYGESYVKMLMKLGLQDLNDEIASLNEKGQQEDTKLKLNLAGRDPDEGLTYIAYEKGALFLKHIENIVGRETFDGFLNKYFEKHAFRVMTSEGFLDYLEQELIKEDEQLRTQINAKGWIYGTNLPSDVPVIESDRFSKVEEQLNSWYEGIEASSLVTNEWSTHEWLHFLRKMPKNLSNTQMAELDKTFGFTTSGNSEILAQWFEISIHNKYEVANDSLRSFLISVGRRKFLAPLYEALASTEEGLKMAKEIYAEARPNYHAVSYNTIDQLLGWQQ